MLKWDRIPEDGYARYHARCGDWIGEVTQTKDAVRAFVWNEEHPEVDWVLRQGVSTSLRLTVQQAMKRVEDILEVYE